MTYTVARTQDEFGAPRYFVEDEEGEWISDAYDTPEAAQEFADWAGKDN